MPPNSQGACSTTRNRTKGQYTPYIFMFVYLNIIINETSFNNLRYVQLCTNVRTVTIIKKSEDELLRFPKYSAVRANHFTTHACPSSQLATMFSDHVRAAVFLRRDRIGDALGTPQRDARDAILHTSALHSSFPVPTSYYVISIFSSQ